MIARTVTSRMSALTRLLGLLLVAAGGCVSHAGPEALALLADGQAAYERTDDQTVIAKTGKFLAENDQTVEADVAYYLRGLAHYRTRDLPAAKEDLTRAAARAQRKDLHLKAIKALGDLAFDAGDTGRAETLFCEALAEMDLKTAPADEVRYRLGCALQRKGQWWDADRQFERLRHDFPDSQATSLAGRRIRCRAWAFQLASFDRKDLAESAAERLEAVGLEPAVRHAVIAGKLRFLVQLGRYETHAQATKDAPRVRNADPNAPLLPTR